MKKKKQINKYNINNNKYRKQNRNINKIRK